jgi:putative transposase
MGILSTTAWFLRALLVPRLHLIIENLALRQQLATYRSSGKRPKLKPRDRLFWVLLRRFWSGWRSVLVIVQPETVVRWHRLGFRLYWRWKSAWGKRGRPKVARELRDLIRRMSRENVTWGAPRIADELRLLGYDVCCATAVPTAYGFCQGERTAVFTSSISMAKSF